MAEKKEPKKKETKKSEGNTAVAIILIILLVIWIIANVTAIIQSLICLMGSQRTGSTGQKIGGVILAFWLGPIYWLYYAFSSDYCKVGAPSS